MMAESAGSIFGKRQSGSANRKSKEKKEQRERELLSSIPKLSSFGFQSARKEDGDDTLKTVAVELGKGSSQSNTKVHVPQLPHPQSQLHPRLAQGAGEVLQAESPPHPGRRQGASPHAEAADEAHHLGRAHADARLEHRGGREDPRDVQELQEQAAGPDHGEGKLRCPLQAGGDADHGEVGHQDGRCHTPSNTKVFGFPPLSVSPEVEVGKEISSTFPSSYQQLVEKGASASIAATKRGNDPGKWGTLSKEDIDFWVRKGPKDCQNHQSDFKMSLRRYKEQNRRFTKALLFRKLMSSEKVLREWLLYSPSTGNIFCFPCLLFGTSTSNVFGDSTIGFNNWKHADVQLGYHEQHKDHREAVLTLVTRGNMGGKIDEESEKLWEEERNYWRRLLKIVVKVIKHLAERALPFRGSNETVGSLENGNFLGTLDLLADFDPFLRNHLTQYGNKGRGRASYLSSTIYEELIELMGDKVLKHILDDLYQAKYFSLCVDSTPDLTHVDQLSLVVRYVDKRLHEVRERFLSFIEIHGHSGESLTNVITNFLEKYKIDIQNARGQSYDNARNMSGKYKGVQARILEINPLATYVPCAAHSLNLAGVCAAESCLDARRFFGIVQQLFNFFSGATHRWTVLISHLGSQRKVLKRLSDTRWSARADAVKALAKGYVQVQNALKDIAKDDHQTAETTEEAKALYNHLEYTDTCVMALLWNVLMERFNRVNLSLQSEDMDLGAAVNMMTSLKVFVNEQRTTFQKIERDAKELIPEGKYRDSDKRQIKRKRQFDEGAGKEVVLSGSERFLINGFFPTIDCLSQAIDTRAEAYNEVNATFGFLNKCWKMETFEVEQAANRLQAQYNVDLEPSFSEEMSHFVHFVRNYVDGKQTKDPIFKMTVPAMYKLIFELSMESTFPNVEIALRIYLSLMVSVAKAERTFSKLKLIKDEKRNCMNQSRLNALSLLSIERSILEQVDFDDVISSFVHAKIRKVHL